MRHLAIVALLAILIALQACLSTLDPTFGEISPTPMGSPTPPTSPTPDQTFGDGHDGTVVLPSGNLIANACRRVTSVDSDSITIDGDFAPFVPGRLVLLHQAKVDENFTSGGTMTVPDTSAAGRWRIFRIAADSSGGDLSSDVVISGFSVNGRVQACTVPEYANLTIGQTANIIGAPWIEVAGSGGIVALYVSGDLTLEGDIEADYTGFRGGVASDIGCTSDVSGMVTTPSTDGGGKGEGIDVNSRTLHGRGAIATAAGGGNCLEAGGGGGGNGGAGGAGGRSSALSEGGGDPNTRGLGGGAAFPTEEDRLVFGAGGGGGHRKSTAATPNGGDGGGAVFVFARRIDGTGSIRANGADGFPGDTTGTCAGGGGGGAGGTILLRVDDASQFVGSLRVTGGRGGQAWSFGQNNYYCGPGSGGGGGRIWVRGGLRPEVLVTGSGGGANVTTGGADDHGSQKGAPGVYDLQ